MLIGVLTKKTDLSKYGLRLIHSLQVTAGTRFCHDYDATTLDRLALIALGKRLHFNLRKMAALLDRLLRYQITREERRAVLLQQVDVIDRRIADLVAARQELVNLAQAPDKDSVDQRLKVLGLSLL
jgi:DNA-binding transcriptional MerR regulator